MTKQMEPPSQASRVGFSEPGHDASYLAERVRNMARNSLARSSSKGSEALEAQMTSAGGGVPVLV